MQLSPYERAQEYYKNYGYKEGDFPISEKLSEKVLSLPMHTELDDKQIELISNSILKFYQKVTV